MYSISSTYWGAVMSYVQYLISMLRSPYFWEREDQQSRKRSRISLFVILQLGSVYPHSSRWNSFVNREGPAGRLRNQQQPKKRYGCAPLYLHKFGNTILPLSSPFFSFLFRPLFIFLPLQVQIFVIQSFSSASAFLSFIFFLILLVSFFSTLTNP